MLIVDDNPKNRLILHDQVLFWGIRNGSAEDGQQALAMLRAAAQEGDPYQLALLDMQMSDIVGISVRPGDSSGPFDCHRASGVVSLFQYEGGG